MDTPNATALKQALAAPVDQPARRAINLIVIHCSATPNGKPLQRGLPGQPGYQNAAQIIDAWHAERGFERGAVARAGFNPSLGHIGYHFIIDLAGNTLLGRGLEEVGAHAAGFNANSIGICMVGGLEKVGQFTPAQWKALYNLVLWQAHVQKIPLAPPRRNGNLMAGGICGHRDLSPDLNHDGIAQPSEWLKTCPGFDVRAWLANGLQPLDQFIFKGV